MEVKDKLVSLEDLKKITDQLSSGITEELDPIFSASVAAGIKSTDISNWNNKTSNTGTVTYVAVKMNGAVKGTVTSSGTIDLGSVGNLSSSEISTIKVLPKSQFDATTTLSETTLYVVTE